MIKLIYHDLNNQVEISQFDNEIVNLVKDKDIKVACPYINLEYFKRILNICKDWKLITDLSELFSSLKNSESKNEMSDFILNNIKKIHNCPSLHAKVIITDEKIFTGSSNLTIQGITKNIELSILIDDCENNKELNSWFNNLWDKTELKESYLKSEIENIIKTGIIKNEEPYISFFQKQPKIHQNFALRQIDKDEPSVEIPAKPEIKRKKTKQSNSSPVIITFTQEIGKQMLDNKRAEFTVKNIFKDLLERWNKFPQRYTIYISNNEIKGNLYKNDRPYYYFKILTPNDIFWKFIEGKSKFSVEMDLEKHIMTIKKI